MSHQPNYKGYKYNIMIEWETGEITIEPLGIIGTDDHITCTDDPITCDIYAKQ